MKAFLSMLVVHCLVSVLPAQEFKECEIVLRRSYVSIYDSSILDLYVKVPDIPRGHCYKIGYHDMNNYDWTLHRERREKDAWPDINKLVRRLNRKERSQIIIEYENGNSFFLQDITQAIQRTDSGIFPERYLVHCRAAHDAAFEFRVFNGTHANAFYGKFRLYILIHKLDVSKCRSRPVNFITPWLRLENVLE